MWECFQRVKEETEWLRDEGVSCESVDDGFPERPKKHEDVPSKDVAKRFLSAGREKPVMDASDVAPKV
jgi:hypothetical protein